MLERIHIIICLFAAIVIGFASFFEGLTLPQMVFRLIITIIVFFLIGSIIKYYLENRVLKKEEPENIDEEAVEDSEPDISEPDEIEEEADNYR